MQDQTPWVQIVSSLGFPIVVVLMIIKGWLVPGFVYHRIVDDNDRLSKVVEEQVIPLVTESKSVLREALVPLVSDSNATLTETRAALVDAKIAIRLALGQLEEGRSRPRERGR